MSKECKNCRKYEGDCGHHARENPNVWKWSACDRYGNCSYYEEGRTACKKAIDSLEEYSEQIGMYINVAEIEKMLTEYQELKQKKVDRGITADKNFARGIANFTEKHLKNDLIRIAEENWTDSQVKMLKGLICAAVNGIEYADAYEAVNGD